MLTQKNETVILMPSKIDRPLKISKNLADQGYKELWGVSIANMAGNVTPRTVQFVADYILAFFSSSVYHKAAGEFGSTVYKIQQEGRTTRFIARNVAYEEKTDKVFVEGDYFVTTDANPFADKRQGKVVPRSKVYEFIIDVSDGRPTIEHFDTYLGVRRDLAFLARENSARANGNGVE